MSIREIKITDIDNIFIGQSENLKAGTGCTVFLSPDGMAAGLDVRGGGPASRESELLKPTATADKIHGIVLAGGSAYGLDAAGGVMSYLEEKGIGYDVGVAKVPLICQSDLFDLTVGNIHVRPDREMGYETAKMALEQPNYMDGCFGAGCGATVGKLRGMEYCMKSGIGSYALRSEDFMIGAVVAVNALGDVYDWKTGNKLAGLLSEDKKSFRDSEEELFSSISPVDNKFVGNTTIGVVVTNGEFQKSQLCKIASMAQDGLARAIRPVHTSADGDSIYAVSVGNEKVDMDVAGTMAALVVSEAIKRAVLSAESGYGYPSAKDI